MTWLRAFTSFNLFKHLSDSELMQHIKERHEPSFNTLYQRYHQALYHYLLAQCERPLAEDVFQIMWQKVIDNAWQFQGEHVKAWLYTLARNTLIDEIRKQKHHANIDDNEWHLAAEASSEHADSIWLQQQLAQLPFLQREAVCLQLEGFSNDDIATMTHASLETVKSRLKLGKQKLKEAAHAV